MKAKTVLFAAALSTGMALLILPVTRLGLGDLRTLLIMVPAGVALYLAGSKIFRVDSFDYVLSAAKKLLRRGREKGETT